MLANNLRLRREALGRSQHDVATEAEVSPGYLSELEQGKKRPSLEALRRLAVALRTEVSELLKEE